jgi:cytoskeleton protein RodZ
MTKDSISADDAIDQPAALSRSDETLGSFLKRHRQSQGKDLEEIAKKIRIHASTLRAIEEDNPKALPAEVFTRGFVKNYAQYLGLDPNEALAWYIEQNNGEVRPTEKINVQEVLAGETLAEVQTFPMGRFIVFFLVAGLLFLAGYLVLSFLNSSAPPAEVSTKEATPQVFVEPSPPQPAPGTDVPVAESGGGSGATEQAAQPATQGSVQASPSGGTGPAEKAVEGKAVAVPEKAGQAVETKKVEGEQGLGVKKKTDDGKPIIVPQAIKEKPTPNPEPQEAVKAAPVAAVAQPSVIKAPGMNYVLEAKFTQPTWISVQIDREKKKSSTYQPGDRAVWQAEKKISVFVGNAGGVVFTLNGKSVPTLGKSMDSARVSFPAE